MSAEASSGANGAFLLPAVALRYSHLFASLHSQVTVIDPLVSRVWFRMKIVAKRHARGAYVANRRALPWPEGRRWPRPQPSTFMATLPHTAGQSVEGLRELTRDLRRHCRHPSEPPTGRDSIAE
jgi:hypothetical protein